MAALVTGCIGSPDDFLSVTDPDIINPSDVQSQAGANAVRLGALARLNSAHSGLEGYALLGGLLVDEWRSGDTFVDRDNIDKRSVIRENSFATTANRTLHRARVMAIQAADLLRTFDAAGPAWQLAEMYFVMGFVENVMAETYCNGVPLSRVLNGVEEPGDAVTTTDLYARALAHVDSGLTIIGTTGTTTNDVRVRNALLITRGRILMNQGQFATAATAVAAVPTTHRHFMFHSASTDPNQRNQIWLLNNSARRYNLADAEGTNGIDFISAADPRVPSCQGGTAPCNAVGVTQTRPFDLTTTFPFRAQLIWPTSAASVEITSGVEARLIQAYGQIMAGDATYVNTLNALRATVGLGNLADAGNEATRLDQLYRERAFWLFAKGHRLGDLRRLVRLHNRTEATTWPVGTHPKGGSYGPDMNFPIPQAEDNNPAFSNKANPGGCIDRNA